MADKNFRVHNGLDVGVANITASTGDANVGNLRINSNTIKSSTGNTAITLSDKDVTVLGNLTVQGTRTSVGTSDLIVQDSIINLHTASNLEPLTTDDSRDIGLGIHYYKTSDKFAFIGWSNSNQSLDYIVDGTESIGGTFTGTYGTFRGATFDSQATIGTAPFAIKSTTQVANLNAAVAGNLINGNSNVIVNANSNVTISVSSTANVLTVTSTGANISGTLNTGTGNANVGNLGTGTVIATTANLTTINSGLLQNGTSNVTVNSSGNVNISVGGNMLTITSTGANIAGTLNTGTGNANVGNLGVTTVLATNVNASSNVNAVTAVNSPAHVNGNSSVNIAANSSVTITATSSATLVVTNVSANVTGNIIVSGDILPTANNSGNIGSSILRFNKLYLAGSTIDLAGQTISSNASGMQLTGNITTSTLTANVADGTAPIIVNSTTRIANLNVAVAGNLINGTSNVVVTSSGNITVGSAGNAAILTVTGTGANIAGYANISLGSITAAQSILAKSVTWNNASVTFTALSTSITDTASAAGSNIADWQVGGSSKFSVNKAGNTSIAGTMNVTGNANIGNLGTSTVIATTANLTTINSGLVQNSTSNVTIASAGNVSTFIGGNATAQLVVTATGANIAGTANVVGAITGGNVSTTGANGTVTSNNSTTSGAATGNLNVGTVTGNLGRRALAATFTDNSAIASATIGNAAAHAIDIPTLAAANLTVTATNAASFYIAGAPTSGTNLTITNPYALLVGAGNVNIAGTGAASSSTTGVLRVGGGVGIAGNIYVGTNANITGTANIGANLTAGNVSASLLTGTLTTASQPNITALGTITTLVATTANLTTINSGLLQNGTSNVTLTTSGNISTFIGGNVTAQLVVTATGANIAGNANVGNLGTATVIATTANLTTINGALHQNGNSNITITANSNVTIAVTAANSYTFATGSFAPSANATVQLGLTGARWSNIWGLASSAQYADLAEYYLGDISYEPGTVLEFGGNNEVTICSTIMSTKIAGVVSTNPGFIMNDGDLQETSIPVALQGRVPTKVVGKVSKGDMMISAGNGYAVSCSSPVIGSVIGKALADFDGSEGMIEVVVGRL